ncbi:MAG: GxxExxY protein [Luteolibacter sp.]
MNDTEAKSLCSKIREEAYDLHQWLRNGHLESVYENGLLHRAKKLGLTIEKQVAIHASDRDGTILGDFKADLFLENELIIELKGAKSLADEHTAQLMGYLRASGKRHGLLINFGAPTLQIKKYVL